MNPLKLIKKKNFYSQEKINSIDFQEIEEKGGKLFKKVYKKIKWEKIDYTEISSDTFDDINWKFVNFKKAVKSKTFDIDKIDFEEAELSKTFKFLDKKSSLGSGGTSNSTTSKGNSDSSLYRQFGPLRNDEVVTGPQSRYKAEFNDKYLIRYDSYDDDLQERTLLIHPGEFEYDSNGSMKGIGIESLLYIRTGTPSSETIDGERSSIRFSEYYFDPSTPDETPKWGSGVENLNGYTRGREVDNESFPDIQSLLSSEIYGRLTSLPQFSQLFEDDQWHLKSVEESNFL